MVVLVALALVSPPAAQAAGGMGAASAVMPSLAAVPVAASQVSGVAVPAPPGSAMKNSGGATLSDNGLPPLPPLPSWAGSTQDRSIADSAVRNGAAPRRGDTKISVAVHTAGTNEYISAKLLGNFTGALRRGDLPAASRILDQLHRLDSEDNVEYLDMAAMYQARAGDLEAALRLTRRALDVAPQDAVAQRNLRALQARIAGAQTQELPGAPERE